MITKKEIKRLIDYTNYIQECVSIGTEINKQTVKDYLNEEHFYNKL
tara:strand:+ start:517 stop:654 length:138 start_codon:yes stop_codon:yes gene_type:complete